LRAAKKISDVDRQAHGKAESRISGERYERLAQLDDLTLEMSRITASDTSESSADIVWMKSYFEHSKVRFSEPALRSPLNAPLPQRRRGNLN